MLAAEATHRAHAVVEQVIADLKAGPLAHLPSGVFTANAAWLALASIAFNLLRAAGVLAAPRPDTASPSRPPPPCEPGWSPSPRGSPAPPAASPCTCRPDGPGTSTGPASPTTPCAPVPYRRQRPEPAHRPAPGPNRNPEWKTRKDRADSPRPPNQNKINQARENR